MNVVKIFELGFKMALKVFTSPSMKTVAEGAKQVAKAAAK